MEFTRRKIKKRVIRKDFGTNAFRPIIPEILVLSNTRNCPSQYLLGVLKSIKALTLSKGLLDPYLPLF